MASISQYFDKMRLVALGIVYCGSGVGYSLFSALTSVMLKHMCWQYCVRISAGFLLLGILGGSTFRPLWYRALLDHVTIMESLKNTFDFGNLKQKIFWILASEAF